jgi:putative transcriptional regulator
MMTNEQLKARDAKRDIGAELLQAVQEIKAGKSARTTTFEPLPDGSVRRTVVLADGALHTREVLVGPQ